MASRGCVSECVWGLGIWNRLLLYLRIGNLTCFWRPAGRPADRVPVLLWGVSIWGADTVCRCSLVLQRVSHQIRPRSSLWIWEGENCVICLHIGNTGFLETTFIDRCKCLMELPFPGRGRDLLRHEISYFKELIFYLFSFHFLLKLCKMFLVLKSRPELPLIPGSPWCVWLGWF